MSVSGFEIAFLGFFVFNKFLAKNQSIAQYFVSLKIINYFHVFKNISGFRPNPIRARFVAPPDDNFKAVDRQLVEAILGGHSDALEKVQAALDAGADPNWRFPERRDIRLHLWNEAREVGPLNIGRFLPPHHNTLHDLFSKEALPRVVHLCKQKATMLIAARQYAPPAIRDAMIQLLEDRDADASSYVFWLTSLPQA